MDYEEKTGPIVSQDLSHRARVVLVGFLLTFISARVIVFLIMSRRIPDLYLHLGGTHIHNWVFATIIVVTLGIFFFYAS